MNLIMNGSEAITGKGTVTISTSNVRIDEPITTSHGIIEPNSYNLLSVQDSGNGIPPKDLPHIFEPFYSTKKLGRSGTGLGLAVVWNSIQDHDGSVQVLSDENGTIFNLYFPCSAQDQQSQTPLDNETELQGGGKSILVVDDELQQRDIASQLLSSLGYNVETASSGEDAVEFIRKQKVDLVLLDMVMGNGLNGRQTYEKLINYSPGQKAIIMSGFSASNEVEETIRLGAQGLINKPYTKKQLSQAIHMALSE